MCIRDRPWKFVVITDRELALKVGKAAAGLGMNKFAKDAPVPVSYTHLDVYKRQEYLQTVILVAWQLPIQGIYIKRYWKCFTNTMQPNTYI